MTDGLKISEIGPSVDCKTLAVCLLDEINCLQAQIDALTGLSSLGDRIGLIAEELDQVPGLRTSVSLIQRENKFTLEIWLEDVTKSDTVPQSSHISPDPAPSTLRADDAEGLVLDPKAVAIDGVLAEGGDEVAAPVPPAAEGKPAAEPKIKAASPAPKKNKGATPFWDDTRCETLIRMKMDGIKAKAIAEKVGTTAGAVAVQWTKIKGGALHKRVLATLPGAKAWTVKDWVEHFEGLPCRAPWRFSDDIDLVRNVKKGAGVAGAAALMRVSREIAKDRWKQLVCGQEDPNFDAMIAALEKIQGRPIAPES